jgi:lipoprotein LprG
MTRRRCGRCLLPGLLVVALLSAGCGGGGNLPDARSLLDRSAKAMGDVSTVRFAIDIDGIVAPLTIRSIKGVLTRAGNATGTVLIALGSDLEEEDFVLVGKSLYLRGATGPYQLVPESFTGRVYDPKVLLAPDHGLPAELSGAQDARTRGAERVNGVSTYRVSATLAPDLLKGLTLLENEQKRLPATLWISQDDGRLQKAEVTFRTRLVSEDTRLTLTLGDFDKPVDIKPPPV